MRLSVTLVLLAALAAPALAQNVARLYERAVPSVVFVTSYGTDGPLATGSGFVVAADGLVATNFHVIDGATRVQVRFRDGREFDAEGAVAYDIDRDYALLKIPARGLPALALRGFDEVEVGERVVAIGNPLGIDFVVSDGIVSQVHDGEGCLNQSREPMRCIQVTAPISHGNSGGPVLDESGHVIGLATWGLTDGNELNYAVAADHIAPYARQGQSVRYSFADLRGAASRRVATLERDRYRAMMEVFEDPEGFFAMPIPRGWLTRETDAWDGAVYMRSVLMAPPEADPESPVVGARVTFRAAPSGQRWSWPTRSWADAEVAGRLSDRPDLVVVDTTSGRLNGWPSWTYALLESGDDGSGRVRIVVLAGGRDFRVEVERFWPAGATETVGPILGHAVDRLVVREPRAPSR